jgi:CRISPR/Cas system CMR subunit Cmr4 (Cas7 group RAMP superfamily)
MLKITYQHNKHLLNSFTVVTTPNDKDTISFCEDNNIHVIKYNCCYCSQDASVVKDPKKLFNLSKMINQGLMYIYEKYPNDWVLYLNSDIILNPKIASIRCDKLNPNILYGCKRCLCPTASDFDKIKNNLNHLNLSIFTDIDGDDAVGLGFFQLFKRVVFYDQHTLNPINNFDASYTDLLFMRKFEAVGVLSDYYVVHLGKNGVNWYGRKSERWAI